MAEPIKTRLMIGQYVQFWGRNLEKYDYSSIETLMNMIFPKFLHPRTSQGICGIADSLRRANSINMPIYFTNVPLPSCAVNLSFPLSTSAHPVVPVHALAEGVVLVLRVEVINQTI